MNSKIDIILPSYNKILSEQIIDSISDDPIVNNIIFLVNDEKDEYEENS